MSRSQLRGKRVLITGGAGFIGSALARRLASEELAEIVVLDNLYRGSLANLERCLVPVRFLRGDIRKAPEVKRAVAGMDVVFHLAAQSQVRRAMRDPKYCFDTNVRGTFHVLEAARDAGVRRLVFTSSREVYGEAEKVPVAEEAPLRAKNGYGLSKLVGELYCQAYEQDMEIVVLRLANVYGPGDQDRVIPIFLEQALNNSALTLLGGKQIMDFVWIEYVLDALVASAKGPWVRGPVNIGSGLPTSLVELGVRILELTESESTLSFQPEIEAEVSHFVADVTRARREFRLPVPDDPLFALPRLVESYRRAGAQTPGLRMRTCPMTQTG